jgi:uncharacterized protein YcbX
MPKAPQPAGAIRVMRRFPVKGMAGEKLGEVFVSFAGLVGDRVYAYFDPQNKTDFPWMTPRIWAKMLLLKPKFVEPAVAHADRPSPKNYRVEITTPKGSVFDIGDQNLLKYMEQQFGRPIILRFSERSMHDSRPVSIFGHKTLDALSTEAGMKLDAQRFRMNFEVDWAKGGAFFEDELIGKQIRIGEKLTLMVAKKNMRCKVITLDPDTAEASPEIFKIVADKHESCVGIYATVLCEGIVRRGDPVFID